MRCPQCGHDNPAQVKFCGECGPRIEGLCPNCGTSNPPTNKFCHQCGQALLAQGQGEQAEAALTRALTIGREIGNPPQRWKTCQALGALYESQADLGRARAAYRSVMDVIDGVAERRQDQELQRTFLAARPVQEIRERLAQADRGRP